MTRMRPGRSPERGNECRRLFVTVTFQGMTGVPSALGMAVEQLSVQGRPVDNTLLPGFALDGAFARAPLEQFDGIYRPRPAAVGRHNDRR